MSSQATMESAPPRTSEEPRQRRHDTGFPESFCGNGNTTLRHPDADTSPNACIPADNFHIEPAATRSKRSFLGKHKHAVKYGKLGGQELGSQPSYNNLSMVSRPHTSSDLSSMDDSIHSEDRLSKDGERRLARASSTANMDVDMSGFAPAVPDSPPRRGILRKFTSRR